MKIQYKNLVGSITYLPALKIYVAEFVVGERVISFSGENEFELYKCFSSRLDPYVTLTASYRDLKFFPTTGKERTLAC
jgi:predicted HicB family RNase H-like nuclease